jgi:hypothetical protein
MFFTYKVWLFSFAYNLARAKLVHKPFKIYQQYPQEISERRRVLVPTMKELREICCVSSFISVLGITSGIFSKIKLYFIDRVCWSNKVSCISLVLWSSSSLAISKLDKVKDTWIHKQQQQIKIWCLTCRQYWMIYNPD